MNILDAESLQNHSVGLFGPNLKENDLSVVKFPEVDDVELRIRKDLIDVRLRVREEELNGGEESESSSPKLHYPSKNYEIYQKLV